MNIIWICFAPGLGIRRIDSLDENKFGYKYLTYVFVKLDVSEPPPMRQYRDFRNKVRPIIFAHFDFDEDTKDKFVTGYSMEIGPTEEAVFDSINNRLYGSSPMPYISIVKCKDVFLIDTTIVQNPTRAILNGIDGMYCNGRCKQFFPYAEPCVNFVCTGCKLWQEIGS